MSKNTEAILFVAAVVIVTLLTLIHMEVSKASVAIINFTSIYALEIEE